MNERINNYREAIHYLKEELPKIEGVRSAILHGSARKLFDDTANSEIIFGKTSDIDLIVLMSGTKDTRRIANISKLYRQVCEKYQIYYEYDGGHKVADLDLLLTDEFTIKNQLFFCTQQFKDYLSAQPTLFGEKFADEIWSDPLPETVLGQDAAKVLSSLVIRPMRKIAVTVDFYYHNSDLMFDRYCFERAIQCAKHLKYLGSSILTDVEAHFKNEDDRETKRIVVDLITSEVEEEICGIQAGTLTFAPQFKLSKF